MDLVEDRSGSCTFSDTIGSLDQDLIMTKYLQTWCIEEEFFVMGTSLEGEGQLSLFHRFGYSFCFDSGDKFFLATQKSSKARASEYMCSFSDFCESLMPIFEFFLLTLVLEGIKSFLCLIGFDGSSVSAFIDLERPLLQHQTPITYRIKKYSIVTHDDDPSGMIFEEFLEHSNPSMIEMVGRLVQ